MIIGIVAAVIVAIVIGGWLVWAQGAKQESVLLSARMVQAAATATAVALGGIFAWRRGLIFRDEQPHITITHEITHRQVSHGYIHLEVAVTMYNSSRVKTEFRDGLFSVEKIAPMSDEYVEQSFANTFLESTTYTDPEWPLLKEIPREWEKDELVVEPGERAVETFEYFVPTNVKSVLISTHFWNVKAMGKIPASANPRQAGRMRKLWFRQADGTRGWKRTTAYDIMQTPNRR